MKNFKQLVILAFLNTFCSLNADNVPVLSYFGSKQLSDSINVGQVLKSNDFLNQIKILLPNSDLDLILVDKVALVVLFLILKLKKEYLIFLFKS